jgi:FMN phosphatase YigB (HAD superfamily)
LFPGVGELLKKIKGPKILVTRGSTDIQDKKVDVLGVRADFSRIVITASDEEKQEAFAALIQEFKIKEPAKVLVIGNRIDSEIRYGNILGCTTIFVPHGRFKDLAPKDSFEIPHFTVEKTADILAYF